MLVMKREYHNDGFTTIRVFGKGNAAIDCNGQIIPFWCNPWVKTEVSSHIDIGKAIWIKQHREQVKEAIRDIMPELTEHQLDQFFSITNSLSDVLTMTPKLIIELQKAF